MVWEPKRIQSAAACCLLDVSRLGDGGSGPDLLSSPPVILLFAKKAAGFFFCYDVWEVDVVGCEWRRGAVGISDGCFAFCFD